MAPSNHRVFPHATGNAQNIVAAHQQPQPLIFHAAWFCPFAQRAWITLEEKRIPYQYKEVNPYNKEPHFLAINPKGLVPAVEYAGKAIYESFIICEFLDEAYPEHKPHLLPQQPIDRAIARIWLDFINKSFFPVHHGLIQAQDPDSQDTFRNKLYDVLKQFSDDIKGPYFFGEEFSIVDIAIAPWIVRDYIVSDHRGFKREQVGQKWVDYTALVEKRDSVVKTSSLKEYYTEIYGRYLRDEAQSEVAKAIREGRALP